jgi:hypothetical protein
MDIGHLLFWAEFVNRFHTKEAGEGPSTTAKFPSLRGAGGEDVIIANQPSPVGEKITSVGPKGRPNNNFSPMDGY